MRKGCDREEALKEGGLKKGRPDSPKQAVSTHCFSTAEAKKEDRGSRRESGCGGRCKLQVAV